MVATEQYAATGTSTGQGSPTGRGARVGRGTGRLALLAVGPALLLVATFVAYPILRSVDISLGSWDGIGAVVWKGLANYRRLVGDALFAESLKVSLAFFLLTTFFSVAIATLLANSISRGVPGGKVFKVIWFLPVVVPVAVSGVFWANAFQPETGVVDTVLGALGLGSGHAWLAYPMTALFAVVFVAVWTQTGYAMLLLLGAMESLPAEVHEAATLDGVGPVSRLWRITLPNIVPMLGTVTTLMVVFSFNAFAVIYAMTKGGPGDATSILPVLVYQQSFLQQDYGYGSATAVVTTVLVGLIGVIVLRLFRQQTLDAK